MMLSPRPGGLTIVFENTNIDSEIRIAMIWRFLYAAISFEQASKCSVRACVIDGAADGMAFDIDVPDEETSRAIQFVSIDRPLQLAKWSPENGTTRLQGEAYSCYTDPSTPGIWT